MGSLNPISNLVQTVTGSANTISNAAKLYGDYRDITRQNQIAKDTYLLNEQDLAEKSVLTRRETDLDAEEDRRQRQRNLQKSSATRKAMFGNQGISTSDGSGKAVLLSLFQDSDEEQQYRDRLNALRRESEEQDTAAKRRRNLLSLQNTHRIGRDNTFHSISRLF